MEDVVKDAREALEISNDFDRDNRTEAMEDLRFTAGFQWSDAARAERAGRPMITINRSSQFVRSVANPIRQNMPTIKVEPDGDADLEMAEVANGLFRRIQYNSSASHVYANATEHMVACGIGWWRVMADYADEESFDQEIMIKRIFNPLSVYPDPSALEPDRSDMNWCVVSELMPRKAFENRWKGKAVTGLDAPANGTGVNSIIWGSGDYIRVGEFWKREATEITLLRMTDGSTQDAASFSKRGIAYLKENSLIAGERKAKSYKVTMTMVSGAEVLEDAYECPCKWIPLVPVIGVEVPLEQGTYRHGLIRFQREPAQLTNYFFSLAAETMGQQTKSQYIVTPKQIGPHKAMWDNANRTPSPYLLHADGTERPQREQAPSIPTGLVQMAQLMEDSQKAATGQYDAALGARSNETSGVAIQGRIEQGNQATSHFTDNLQHSLEHTGRIILDMAPKIYDTKRTLRMMAEDGTETEARINHPVMGADGQQAVMNDMNTMNFKSVRVIMGPSYASRRAEAVQSLTQLIQAVPQIGQVGADIIVRNMDFEGAEQLAERLKTILPPQIVQAENPEAAAAQQPPPDPMAEMQQQGQAEMMKIEVATAQSKAAQEAAKADQEAKRVDGVDLDNALKMKKLHEPKPEPNGHGAPAQHERP